MSASFFCVDLIRSLFADTLAVSAIRGKSVKTSFLEGVDYISRMTGMAPEEIAEFFPSEYKISGGVEVAGKYHNFTLTKSRFELYPLVS